MNVFQCDVTHDKLTTHVHEESVDIVTVIFVMSSISPDKMLPVLENIATVSGNYLVLLQLGLAMLTGTVKVEDGAVAAEGLPQVNRRTCPLSSFPLLNKIEW